jgi:hypothetical protein
MSQLETLRRACDPEEGLRMCGKLRQSLLIGTSLLLLVGCATKEEWDIWLSNKSHFASKEHYDFSMKNSGGSRAAVTRQDVAMAQSQGWFGKAITVAQEQILER